MILSKIGGSNPQMKALKFAEECRGWLLPAVQLFRLFPETKTLNSNMSKGEEKGIKP